MTMCSMPDLHIDWLKSQAPQWDFLRTFKDEELLRLVVAWKCACARFEEPYGQVPEGHDARLEWIWSRSKFDLDKWAIAAGLPIDDFAFLNLARACIIYPDGTYNDGGLMAYIGRSTHTKQEKEDDEK